MALTQETLVQPWVDEPDGRTFSLLELLLYNMRHVQHHAARMNMLLRQDINDAPGWGFPNSSGFSITLRN